jgi:NAD(P)-dependent dehydrogenase (short-subunit alcohol dehydrogenase family)
VAERRHDIVVFGATGFTGADRWTAADIPDQNGRVAVLTGANSGLGLVTARELTRAGARVILGCRSSEKGQSAAATIRGAVPSARVEPAVLDLADLDSVRAFAAAVPAPLDLLINNAGVMAPPRRLTKQGFESQGPLALPAERGAPA